MELFFSPRGRLNRARYILASFGSAFLLPISFFVFFVVVEMVRRRLGGTAMPGPGDAGRLVHFVVLFAYLVMTGWISLCLTAKRYHDLDKSGIWMLISLVPIVGPLVFFAQVYCQRGTDGPNTYGPDPLGPSESRMMAEVFR